MSRSGPRVLVTDGQDRCGLAAVRCLCASGHRVTAAALHRSAPGMWVRGLEGRQVLPDPRDNIDRFTHALQQLLGAEPHDVVLPGRDETLYAISARREELGPAVQTSLPPHAAVLRALDKLALAEDATSVGLAPPPQRLCQSDEQATAAAAEFGWPVLVKPIGVCFDAGEAVGRHPSRLVSDAERLQAARRELGDCIVQQRVEGTTISVGGVAADGELVGTVVARYIRTWRPDAGNASFAETIDPPAGLLDRIAALVNLIGWRGIFEVELMQAPDGALHALDFNPRLYGSLSLARASGAPLTTLWCDWLVGRNPQAITANPGIRYRLEDAEIMNLARHLRRAEFARAAAVARPRRHTVHAYLQASDPIPGLIHSLSLGRGSVRSVASRLKTAQ